MPLLRILWLLIISFKHKSCFEIPTAVHVHPLVLKMSHAIVEITTTFEFGTDAAVTIIKPRLDNFAINDVCKEVVEGTINAMTVEILDYQSLNGTKNQRLYNVVIISNYEDFEPVPQFYDRKSLDYNGFLIVALLLDSSESRLDVAYEILDDLWAVNVLNAVVLTHGLSISESGDFEDGIQTSTGLPYYSEDSCEEITLMTVPFVLDGFEYQSLDKVENMHGCPQNVSFNLVTKDNNNGHFGYDKKLEKYVGIDVEFFESECNYFCAYSMIFYESISLL